MTSDHDTITLRDAAGHFGFTVSTLRAEATDAGAQLEHIRHAATHSDIATTQRYSRGSAEKVEVVQKMRNEHRSKAS